ncbi:hypothetical protein D9M71_175980 [compost metagenome]
MKRRTEPCQQPGLHTEVAIPGHAFEKGIDEGHDQHGCAQLRAEFRPLGDAAGNDRRYGSGKGQQEKELDQFVAVIAADHRRRLKKTDPIRDPIAYKEIGQRRYSKIAEDLRQCVDLVFMPHRPDLKEGKTGVHGQDHDRTDQDEQRV